MSKEATAPATNFDALLAEIQGQSAETETLSKAIENDDSARIEAAAEEGDEGEGDEGDEGKGGGEGCDKDGDKDGGKPFGKSFTMTGEDGEQVEGIDATELLKSLMDQVETLESNSSKGLEAILGVVKAQGQLIKSLSDKVGALSSQGRGRRAVVSIADKPGSTTEELAKSDASAQTGISALEYRQHMQVAAEEGMIAWSQANFAETCLNKGMDPPAEVTNAVAKVKARLAGA